jgi:tetratricopeptide (TPR) repeat protein
MVLPGRRNPATTPPRRAAETPAARLFFAVGIGFARLRYCWPMPSIEQLRKLLEAEPGDAFLLYGMAQELAKAGDHASAIGWYDRCLGADPAYLYAYFHKARSQEALGDTPTAIATLRAGLKAARERRDSHATAEISGYLDELTP